MTKHTEVITQLRQEQDKITDAIFKAVTIFNEGDTEFLHPGYDFKVTIDNINRQPDNIVGIMLFLLNFAFYDVNKKTNSTKTIPIFISVDNPPSVGKILSAKFYPLTRAIINHDAMINIESNIQGDYEVIEINKNIDTVLCVLNTIKQNITNFEQNTYIKNTDLGLSATSVMNIHKATKIITDTTKETQ